MRIVGTGGFVAAGFEVGEPSDRVDNKSWVLNTSADIDDTSDTGTGAWRQGTAILNKMDSLEITIFDDDSQYFDVIGLTEGVELDMYLKRGAASLYTLVANTILQNIRETNENDKVRGIVLIFQYGTVERDATAPTIA